MIMIFTDNWFEEILHIASCPYAFLISMVFVISQFCKGGRIKDVALFLNCRAGCFGQCRCLQ